jgi:site-specific DNA-methyltransferase (adenine-specific)/modification methylase
MTSIDIRQSDCVAGMKKIRAGTVAVVFADPPYNLSGKKMTNRVSRTGGAFEKVNEKWDTFSDSEYLEFTAAWLSESHRVLKPAGAIYVCASQHNLGPVLIALEKIGFKVKNIIVWEKPNAMPNLTRRTFTHSVEFVIWAVKGKGWTFNFEKLKVLNPDRQKDGSPKMLRDVWRLPVVQGVERLRGKDGKALHPTQKPETLVERCLVASSSERDLVVDPFSGSGTTAVVSQKLGRRFLGFEMEPKYVEASLARLQLARLRGSQ